MLNQQAVLKDAYYLLCIFMAGRTIFDITNACQRVHGGSEQSDEPLFTLYHNFNDDEINHTLIKLAIYNRKHMEFLYAHENIEEYEYPENPCGTLINDVEQNNVDCKLYFREACHKIIHAEKHEAVFIENEDIIKSPEYMLPMHHIIFLYGTRNGINWKAELDVLQFIRETIKNINFW